MFYWAGDVSKPPEMSRITKGIARNLSCAIRQRERPRLEKEREIERGETQNGLFHNRLTDLLALSS